MSELTALDIPQSHEDLAVSQLDRIEDKLDEILDFFDTVKALAAVHPVLKGVFGV